MANKPTVKTETKTKITTDNPELRKEFLGIIANNLNGDNNSYTGKLLVSVGEQTELNGQYTFEVEYV